MVPPSRPPLTLAYGQGPGPVHSDAERHAAALRVVEYLGDAANVTPEEEQFILAMWDNSDR